MGSAHIKAAMMATTPAKAAAPLPLFATAAPLTTAGAVVPGLLVVAGTATDVTWVVKPVTVGGAPWTVCKTVKLTTDTTVPIAVAVFSDGTVTTAVIGVLLTWVTGMTTVALVVGGSNVEVTVKAVVISTVLVIVTGITIIELADTVV
jgi:hypothetical protein